MSDRERVSPYLESAVALKATMEYTPEYREDCAGVSGNGRVKLDTRLGDTAPGKMSKEEYQSYREDHGATTRRLSRPRSL